MSLKLSKINTAPYDYYSTGDGLTPITTTVTLDNTGGIKGSTVVTCYLVATTYNYTGIVVAPVSEEPGINWRVSLDNVEWSESVNPPSMDALSEDVTRVIYIAAVVSNDGSVHTGNHIQCKVRITATENP